MMLQTLASFTGLFFFATTTTTTSFPLLLHHQVNTQQHRYHHHLVDQHHRCRYCRGDFLIDSNPLRSLGVASTVNDDASASTSSCHQETTTTTTTRHDSLQRTIQGLHETMGGHFLMPRVLDILEQWANENSNVEKYTLSQGIVNKMNLLHEVQESVASLGYFIKWLDQYWRVTHQTNSTPLCLVDLCCGKGIQSLLASYLFQIDARIAKIIMMDHDANLDWSHVDIVNQYADEQGRPRIVAQQGNLFDTDQIIAWLESETTMPVTGREEEASMPLALFGVHLCKNLSPAFVGLANVLGEERALFALLAPCCLPRAVGRGSIDVLTFELPKQRQARKMATQRRKRAKQRITPCLLCTSTKHSVRHCPHFYLLPTHEDQEHTLQLEREARPCWKCGKLGHTKSQCPSQQSSSLPLLVAPPSASYDVSHLLQDEDTFESYCRVLCTSMNRTKVEVLDARLTNAGVEALHHEHQKKNWNRRRKSMFLVGTAGSNKDVRKY